MTVDFYNRNIKVDQNTCPLRLFVLNIILFIYVTRSREGKRNTVDNIHNIDHHLCK